MDKLKLHSPDFTQTNIAKLAELFPNCVTEIMDENGKPKKAIDFDHTGSQAPAWEPYSGSSCFLKS